MCACADLEENSGHAPLNSVRLLIVPATSCKRLKGLFEEVYRPIILILLLAGMLCTWHTHR